MDALANDLAFELLKRQKHIEVRRPTDVVVLNCWVTETKEALLLSRISTILAPIGCNARVASGNVEVQFARNRL